MTNRLVKAEAQRAIIDRMGFHAYIDDRGFCCISLEHGDDAGDYWGEFRGGYPWVNPRIVAFADGIDCHVEWVNPGAIYICDN